MSKQERKIKITPVEQPSKGEIQDVQDFGHIITRFDEAKKPLTRRKLFSFNQRWYFIVIVIILLLLFILLEIS
jgi:hypothetical protein